MFNLDTPNFDPQIQDDIFHDPCNFDLKEIIDCIKSSIPIDNT